MIDPGPQGPETAPDGARVGNGLAFPPAGEAPDPGPLGRSGGRLRPGVSSALPLPPPAALPPRAGRRPRRRASSASRLALLITLLAILGAGLTIAAREAGVAWRLPAAFSTEPPATETPGPPPTPMAALAMAQLQGIAGRSSADAATGAVAWERRLRQLTLDGCCVGAWWSADSKQLRFVDRPEGSPQAAVYTLPIWPPGALPAMFDGTLAPEDGEPRFSARPEGDISIVADQDTGKEWSVATGGNPTLVAADGSAVVWYVSNGGRGDVDDFNRFHAADIDGSGQRSLGGLWGGALLRFEPDARHVLALGRQAEGSAGYTLQRITVADGTTQEIASGLWLSDVALSPDGLWVSYMVSLDREHPESNGIWVAPTEAGRVAPVKLELPGAYRWRNNNRLVYVPQLPGAPSRALLQFDPLVGKSSILLDPTDLAIRIADNDWSLSPDGRFLAFRAEEDRCIWLLELPE